MNIFSVESLNFEDWSINENYSGGNVEMSKVWKAEKLGFHLERLDPAKFGCPYHKHYHEEELFLAIKGEATIRQEGEFFQIKAGDVFFFKTHVTHQLYNHSDEPFYFFALSNKDLEDVCEYPDSNKILERKTRKITQNGIVVSDYLKDEENPKNFWPNELTENKT
ncbi:cupin domain-containing protein [Legionella anisa]|uniref:cupin domain-containing protein n=1 Tax=Legionella anisa TaxID=28082 RepID=UPI0013EFA7A3|nr:cupin domain-containing protein [Legionella anisa]